MEIPIWWLTLSAVWFAMGIILNVALVVVIMRLIPMIKALHQRVERLGAKVEDIATDVKETVSIVRARTTAIAVTAEDGSAEIARRMRWVSVALTGLFTTTRVMKFLSGMFGKGKAK